MSKDNRPQLMLLVSRVRNVVRFVDAWPLFHAAGVGKKTKHFKGEKRYGAAIMRRWLVNTLLVFGLVPLASCSQYQSHLSLQPAPVVYQGAEFGQIIALKERSDSEIMQQAYGEANAAALYLLGLRGAVPRRDQYLTYRKKLFAASASLGFAPAFIELSVSEYDHDRWASLVCLKMAVDMGHKEVAAGYKIRLKEFEKEVGHSVESALKRDVNRLHSLVKKIQTQMQEQSSPEEHKLFVHWLLEQGGLTSESRELCYIPTDSLPICLN